MSSWQNTGDYDTRLVSKIHALVGERLILFAPDVFMETLANKLNMRVTSS